MKVLSIRQPWASAIVDRVKDIENRTWETPFRGDFLIHATRWTSERQFYADMNFIWDRVNDETSFIPSSYRDFGEIIGQATLVDCVRSSRSHWFEGPVGFVLTAAHRIDPIRTKGALGFWEYKGPVS